MKVRNIFAQTNRGVLLDTVVFITNLGLMSLLITYFIDVIRRAGEDDTHAQLILLMCSLAMFVLPAAGAVLKRWHFHQRRSAQANKQQGAHRKSGRMANAFNPMDPESKVASGCANVGCLFNAIFHFVLAIFLSAVVMSLLQALVFGKKAEKAAVFVPLVIFSFVMCVVQTLLVYRYFSPPKKAPEGAFLRNPSSEQLGDLCIFVNMILFQVFWNIVVREFPTLKVTRFSDFAGNLFFLSFIALLIYFPPRIFYLAEDLNRPATWITMFVANLPTILRVLFGKSQGVTW